MGCLSIAKSDHDLVTRLIQCTSMFSKLSLELIVCSVIQLLGYFPWWCWYVETYRCKCMNIWWIGFILISRWDKQSCGDIICLSVPSFPLWTLSCQLNWSLTSSRNMWNRDGSCHSSVTSDGVGRSACLVGSFTLTLSAAWGESIIWAFDGSARSLEPSQCAMTLKVLFTRWRKPFDELSLPDLHFMEE